MAELNDLPYELIDAIYDFLPLGDASQLSMANKYNHDVWSKRKDVQVGKKLHEVGYDTDKLTIREHRDLYIHNREIYGKYTNSDIDRWIDILQTRLHDSRYNVSYMNRAAHYDMKEIISDIADTPRARMGLRTRKRLEDAFKKIEITDRVHASISEEYYLVEKIVHETKNLPARKRFTTIINRLNKLSFDTAGY